jgi:hypothetical protein
MFKNFIKGFFILSFIFTFTIRTGQSAIVAVSLDWQNEAKIGLTVLSIGSFIASKAGFYPVTTGIISAASFILDEEGECNGESALELSESEDLRFFEIDKEGSEEHSVREINNLDTIADLRACD